jgi:hypothetical protein
VTRFPLEGPVGKSSPVSVPTEIRASRSRVDWSRVSLWAARLAWLAVALVGGRAVGDAVASRSDAVQLVATVGAWVAWGCGAVALAVPSVPCLTAVRAVVPGAIVIAIATAVGGAPAGSVLALLAPALVTAVLVAGGDVGRLYVQASAYGDEQRFPLRPPLGYLVAAVLSWLVWVPAVVAAPLAWAAGAWIVGAVTSVLAIGATWVLPTRWHQLSRRWLVAVPAGLVVHDPVVLAETVMIPRARVTRVGLVGAARGNGAFDMTGPTPGVAVGIVLDDMVTATLAPRPATPRGTAVHLSALLVAPTRPGAVLREAADRGLPVA